MRTQPPNSIFAIAVLLVGSIQQFSFGDDAIDKSAGSAEIRAKLIAAQDELKKAVSDFRKALPNLPDYKAAKTELDHLESQLNDARSKKDDDAISKIAKAKIVAGHKLESVRSNLNSKWTSAAEAKVTALQDRLDEIDKTKSAQEQNWKQSASKQLKEADADWEAKQAQLPADQRPFEIKGDRLGMSLDMFKRKYSRTVSNDPRPLPFCSDDNPSLDVSTLLYKAEDGKAGIVKARTTFPFEEFGLTPNFPTIAGVPSQSYIYSFLDGKLFDISIFFHRKDYPQVLDAIKTKFGDPSSQSHHTYQNAFGASFEGDVQIWSNSVSSMQLFELAGNVDDSLLILSHISLSKSAEEKLKAVKKSRARDL